MVATYTVVLATSVSEAPAAARAVDQVLHHPGGLTGDVTERADRPVGVERAGAGGEDEGAGGDHRGVGVRDVGGEVVARISSTVMDER